MPTNDSSSLTGASASGSASPSPLPPRGPETPLHREIDGLKRRMVDEASAAISMLESSLEALWHLDAERAKSVIERDAQINQEEVAIEERCLRILALHQPMARDFRELAFVLKVNADIERVADHACSVAKIAKKLVGKAPEEWPQALVELGQRVPMACASLLRALNREDAEAAKQVIVADKTIDKLHKQLFNETVSLMRDREDGEAVGLLVYRIGRELERVGDLMTNIAEDIVYLVTGEIVRHEKKRLRAEQAAAEDLG